MRLKPTFLSICAIFSLGVAVEAGNPQPVKKLHYEVKLKSASFGDMGTRKLWMKGKNLRWEAYSGKLPLWLIKNSKGIFLVNPFRKSAAQYPAGTKRDNPMTLLPGPAGPVNEFLKSVKAVKHGKQTLNKQTCTVYTYKEPTTCIDCTLWVGTKSAKPVQLLLKSKRKMSDAVTVTYTKFDEKTAISDSLFELPKGCPIRPMPSKLLTSEKKAQQPNKKSG